MYLYLRQMNRAGRLSEASASSEALLSLIRLPGNPTKPYYFPLIDRGRRDGQLLSSFWRSPNIPGSWSPGSIHRQGGGSWLANDSGQYVMPDNHVDLALSQMLYGNRVSAAAMGAYFLRNDAFVVYGQPKASEVIAGFRHRFDYPLEATGEFTTLFVTEPPTDVSFSWFEPAGNLTEGGSDVR